LHPHWFILEYGGHNITNFYQGIITICNGIKYEIDDDNGFFDPTKENTKLFGTLINISGG